jgi:predicted TIM-barrel fold metal-dependent hydrolase
MSTTESAPATARDAGRLTGIIDSDVHPNIGNGLQDLHDNMPAAWRKKLGIGGGNSWSSRFAASSYVLPLDYLYINSAGAYREDAIVDGQAPATDARFTAEQLFDGHGIDIGVLIAGHLFGIGAFPDPDVAATVASAYNEWMCERWLQVDPRFRGAMVVAPQDPALAVKEIERMQGRPGIVSIFLPLHDILHGERHYYPIYEAAQKHGLPITVHPSGTENVFARAPRMAGTPTYYIEWHTALSQIHQSNVLSLVCHGVFERFPELMYVIAEGGFAWAAEIMWKLDRDRKGLGDEVPWLRLAPSEYIRRNVRFTTQPMVEPAKKEHLPVLLDMVCAEETLIFSSDYPHWDFDEPRRALSGVPKDLLRKICVDNPRALYGGRL